MVSNVKLLYCKITRGAFTSMWRIKIDQTYNKSILQITQYWQKSSQWRHCLMNSSRWLQRLMSLKVDEIRIILGLFPMFSLWTYQSKWQNSRRFHLSNNHNYVTANSDLDRRMQIYGFREGRVGISIYLNTNSTSAISAQPRLQIRCIEQTSWLLGTNNLP